MTDDNPEDQSKPETGDEEPDAPSGGEANDGETEDGEAGGGSADSGKDREPSPPEQLLDALQEEIDETRRRLDVSGTDDGDADGGEGDKGQGDKAFIDEGERDEDEPVDDTIAPPG